MYKDVFLFFFFQSLCVVLLSADVTKREHKACTGNNEAAHRRESVGERAS
jgi:hypothetical protein